MKIIIPVLPDYNNEKLDAILDAPGDATVSSLELLDKLILRARERGLDVEFLRPVGYPPVNLDMAYRLRYDRGFDIRSSLDEFRLKS